MQSTKRASTTDTNQQSNSIQPILAKATQVFTNNPRQLQQEFVEAATDYELMTCSVLAKVSTDRCSAANAKVAIDEAATIDVHNQNSNNEHKENASAPIAFAARHSTVTARGGDKCVNKQKPLVANGAWKIY